MMDSSQYVVRALLAERVLSEADVKRANEHAASNGWDVTDSLIELGIVGSRRLAIKRAKICECPFVDLAHYDIDFGYTTLAPRAVLERLTAFPLFVHDGVATVGVLDSLNLTTIDQLRQLLRMDVEPVLCDAEQLRGLIARAYGLSSAKEPAGAASKPGSGENDKDLTTGDEPIVLMVNQIMMGAVESGASDVHINPDEHEIHLR